jgi:hypothetical protein
MGWHFRLSIAILSLFLSCTAFGAEGESRSVISTKGPLILWKVNKADGSSHFVLSARTASQVIHFPEGTPELEARKTLFAMYVAHQRAKCAEKAGAEDFKACISEPLEGPDVPTCMPNWTLQKIPGITTNCS